MINNLPMGNEWYLQDADDKSVNYGKRFRFCFEEFMAEDIRNLIKAYVWQNYQSGAITLSSISMCYRRLKTFHLFACRKGIKSLSEFNTNDVDEFMTFLRVHISERTGKPLCRSTQLGVISALKSLVYWGQVFAAELAPEREIFIGDESCGFDTKHKIEYIPDDVIAQINAALPNEENPYIKYGIIILLSTGIRISELLNLEIDCVSPHLLNGYTLTVYDFKNRRQRRRIPINPECADAVAGLADITAELRVTTEEPISKLLLLYNQRCHGTVTAVGYETFRKWLNGCTDRGRHYPGFMERHSIVGSDGEIYKIKTQQFRKTVATDMFSKNVDLKVIQSFLSHKNPGTTKRYYADSKDIDRAKVFERAGIIGSVGRVDSSIIADESERLWFDENKSKGAKMCDGYCTKPIIDGEICERLASHQKCYTCSRYITTPEYLQEHKAHLAELEVQLTNNIYGPHYAAHLSPTIVILKDIIKRLEAIKGEP